jgi:antitoxin component YwqK of YwqJK toxin-antitoxin module
MKYIVLFLFNFQLICCFSQNTVDSKGKKQGAWSKSFPNSSVLQYKGQFKDNIPTGTFIYYYESGAVKAKINHGTDAKRSEAFFYFENGELMSFGIYRNQKKDSVWSNFNERNFLLFTETFKDDLLHGKKTTFYLEDATNGLQNVIAAEANYEKGKLNGDYFAYFLSGKIKEKGSYSNDVRTGVWTKFHPNGNKMLEERLKMGIKHGWQYSYDETGKEIGKSYYFNGEKLEGKVLDAKLEYFKKNGIDPNQ